MEEKQESARQRTLARELEWVRMLAKARQAKSKARLADYEHLVAEETGERRRDEVEIQIPAGPRLGDLVVEAEGLTKGYGDRLLIDDLTFTLPRGGIVGVIGPNGAGKTTLFRMIVGQEKPDGGQLRVGRRPCKLAYVDQTRDALDPAKTVFEEISGRPGPDHAGGKREVNSRAYVGSVQLHAARTSRRRSASSRAASATASTWPSCCGRAATCCCSTSRPTTSTSTRCARWRRRSLDFAGCAVVISHDRWFLDRIATHILAFEGDSKVVWCEGNFQEYEAAPQAGAWARRRAQPAPHHLPSPDGPLLDPGAREPPERRRQAPSFGCSARNRPPYVPSEGTGVPPPRFTETSGHWMPRRPDRQPPEDAHGSGG